MNLHKGVVICSTGSWYAVRLENKGVVKARIKGKFRIKGIKTTNPVAVGDNVWLDKKPDGEYMITEILPRKNYIIRKSVNLSKQAHIIASNIDQALLIVTVASPSTSTGFIDRFLVTAEAYHIPVTIVFNKIDVYNKKEQDVLTQLLALYRGIGYPCILTSAIKKEGVEEVKNLLKDKVTLLSGHSGVGKSTLINAVDGKLDLKTGSVSESHNKGKHTTTFAEMFALSFGGNVIDTPGIKGFGLVDFDKHDLGHYFVEIRDWMKLCKFNNCQHINEPKCAVLEALKNGEIAKSRYQNYLSMWHDDYSSSYRELGY